LIISSFPQDEAAKVVQSPTKKPSKNLSVTDDTGTIRVALWEQKTTSPCKAGDRVKMTHVKTRMDSYWNTTTVGNS